LTSFTDGNIQSIRLEIPSHSADGTEFEEEAIGIEVIRARGSWRLSMKESYKRITCPLCPPAT
jgi:hypothetical protein